MFCRPRSENCQKIWRETRSAEYLPRRRPSWRPSSSRTSWRVPRGYVFTSRNRQLCLSRGAVSKWAKQELSLVTISLISSHYSFHIDHPEFVLQFVSQYCIVKSPTINTLILIQMKDFHVFLFSCDNSHDSEFWVEFFYYFLTCILSSCGFF